MDFTYKSYSELINFAKELGYCFRTYRDIDTNEKTIVLRHDIDMSLDKAVEMAELELALGVKSTYFVLLTSNFYNMLSNDSISKICRIKKLGHSIGLHFDEANYPEHVGNTIVVEQLIMGEIELLSCLLDSSVDTFSYHRPSNTILESYLEIPGLINSYGRDFFEGFKYVSDSRRNWREPIMDILGSNKFDKIHILTHPFWYYVNEKTLEETLNDFVSQANTNRYQILNSNFSSLESVLPKALFCK